jgi:hypothetical protein
MSEFRSRSIFVTALLIFFLVAAASANGQVQSNSRLGFLFSPAHLPNPSNQDVVQAVLEIGAIGGHGSFMFSWQDGSTALAQAQQVAPLFRAFGLKVFLQFSPTGIGAPAPPDGLTASFADPAVRSRFLQDIASLAALKPDYLNLGAEINLLYYLNKTEFANYQTLYQQAYASVKSISPNTQVGVSYHMDLFFGDQEFNLLTDLGPQDFIGFTTYPAWTVYKGFYPAPDQLAAAYYDRIREVIPTAPVFFTEVGWPSGGLSSMSDQNKYISSLPKYFAKTNPALITFALQHDSNYFQVNLLNQAQILTLQGFQVDPTELFDELNTMGLLSQEGPPKTAYLSTQTLNFNTAK